MDSDDDLQRLYAWIDSIPLSRPKRNVPRDFSDGVMLAEIIHHFLPSKIEVHNYTPANATKQKQENWRLLNQKVLRKMQLTVPDNVVEGIIACKPGVVEVVLNNVKQKIEQLLAQEPAASSRDSLYAQSSAAPPSQPQPFQQALAYQPGAPQQYPPHAYLQPQFMPMAGYPNPAQPAQAQQPSPMHMQSQQPPDSQHAYRQPSLFQQPAVGSAQPGFPSQAGPQMQRQSYPQPPTQPYPLQAGHPSQQQQPYSQGFYGDSQLLAETQRALAEREKSIVEYQQAVDMLQAKVRKLEQLVELKDKKTEELSKKLKANGIKP
eukprot:m.105909 g.105909  ORF g.105909 m.105909 type:complete len:319 (+) comp51664_c0_seq2:113-1069(+)